MNFLVKIVIQKLKVYAFSIYFFFKRSESVAVNIIFILANSKIIKQQKLKKCDIPALKKL